MNSTDHTVDELVLGVVNDGSGADCGMSYRDRCAVADYGIGLYRVACKRYGRLMRVRFEQDEPTNAQIIEAASIVQAYYRQHMREQ